MGEEAELSEEIPGLEGVEEDFLLLFNSVFIYSYLPLGDDIEGISLLSLLAYQALLVDLIRFDPCQDLLELLFGEIGKEEGDARPFHLLLGAQVTLPGGRLFL